MRANNLEPIDLFKNHSIIDEWFKKEDWITNKEYEEIKQHKLNNRLRIPTLSGITLILYSEGKEDTPIKVIDIDKQKTKSKFHSIINPKKWGIF